MVRYYMDAVCNDIITPRVTLKTAYALCVRIWCTLVAKSKQLIRSMCVLCPVERRLCVCAVKLRANTKRLELAKDDRRGRRQIDAATMEITMYIRCKKM